MRSGIATPRSICLASSSTTRTMPRIQKPECLTLQAGGKLSITHQHLKSLKWATTSTSTKRKAKTKPPSTRSLAPWKKSILIYSRVTCPKKAKTSKWRKSNSIILKSWLTKLRNKAFKYWRQALGKELTWIQDSRRTSHCWRKKCWVWPTNTGRTFT